MTCFQIEILTQHWLQPEPACAARQRRLVRWIDRRSRRQLRYDPVHEDLCSHGRIKLMIGGQIISGEDNEIEYGISETALGLLRTLESDHTFEAPVVPDWNLVASGSGALLMIGDPIGIEWSVEHLEHDVVRVRNVRRCDTMYPGDAIRLDVDCELSEDQYRREIVAFAVKAKQLFVGVEKRFADKYDQQMYEDFWREYDERLTRAGAH